MSRPKRLCVFLLQLGGPENLQAIEPFLTNLFEDVLGGPLFLRKRLARFIAKKRAPKVAPYYQHIGGGSPILANTRAQASALEALLAQSGFDVKVFTVMRYAPPRVEEVLAEARRLWSDATWVALPLYPQYSFATTRSSMEELVGQLTTPEQERLVTVQAYPADEHYLDAVAACVLARLNDMPESVRAQATILFSAHGLPMSLVRQGDPYPEHVQKTVAGVQARLPPNHEVVVSYQSRVGPVRWLTPATDATIRRLGAEGKKAVLLVPISFVSEHVETLYELDVEVAHIAKEAGIEHYYRAATPMTQPTFIKGLHDLVTRALPD